MIMHLQWHMKWVNTSFIKSQPSGVNSTPIAPQVLGLLKRKKKPFNLRKPSFTKGLAAKSVKKKNMLYKGFLNNPNSSNKNANKSYKNKLALSL